MYTLTNTQIAECRKYIIEMSNMKGFIYNIIKTLNSDNVEMEQIQPYIVEYAELWARLNRIISIEQVAFKI